MKREDYLREKYTWTGDQIQMVEPPPVDDRKSPAAEGQNRGETQPDSKRNLNP